MCVCVDARAMLPLSFCFFFLAIIEYAPCVILLLIVNHTKLVCMSFGTLSRSNTPRNVIFLFNYFSDNLN